MIAGHVTVDGEVVADPGQVLAPGQAVKHCPDLPRRRPGRPTPIQILHLDTQLVVVNKPAGLLVHQTIEREKDTLLHRTADEIARRTGKRAPLFVVHRLDRDTSGVMVLARTTDAARRMQQAFKGHSINRKYIAIVEGDLRRTGRIEMMIGRSDPAARRTELREGGLKTVTRLRRIERLAGATLVEATLETGRTHQVRVVLKSLGHPIIGDELYGESRTPVISRPALHACQLGFRHPSTGAQMAFDCAPPTDFREAVRRLGGREQRVENRD